jgi:hypothetical protein
MNQWQRRIAQEIALLATRFDEINFDDTGFGWVHIPRFELPRGWSRPTTELLILLPSAYPQVAPNGFYIDQRLRPLSGRVPAHYFEEPGTHNPLGDRGWAWYCIHAGRGNWSPKASVWQGDNLLKYIELIRAVLTEIAQNG